MFIDTHLTLKSIATFFQSFPHWVDYTASETRQFVWESATNARTHAFCFCFHNNKLANQTIPILINFLHISSLGHTMNHFANIEVCEANAMAPIKNRSLQKWNKIKTCYCADKRIIFLYSISFFCCTDTRLIQLMKHYKTKLTKVDGAHSSECLPLIFVYCWKFKQEIFD